MHDHGAVSVLWTYEGDDPFALTLHAEGTSQWWQVDRQMFSKALGDCVPGVPISCGVASLLLRLSNPSALSLRLTEYTQYGERYAYLVCNALDVAKYLDDVNKIAPKSFRKSVDDTIEKIFASNPEL
jgi:hypothetical protein